MSSKLPSNKEMQEWVNDTLPPWARLATKIYCEKGEYRGDDYEEVVRLAKEPDDSFKLGDDDFDLMNNKTHNFSIKKIDNVKNVGAINFSKGSRALEFKENGLTVIYGENGAGKSSYMKILKRVANIKDTGEGLRRINPRIYTNIYNGNDDSKPSCDVGIDDSICHFDNLNKISEDEIVYGIDIFDTDIANAYLDRVHQSVFRPQIIDYFQFLEKIEFTVKDEFYVLKEDGKYDSEATEKNIEKNHVELNKNMLKEKIDEIESALEINENYKKNFEYELKKLSNGMIKAHLCNREKREGQLFSRFELALTDNDAKILDSHSDDNHRQRDYTGPVDRVLSEGECRIVALASFLANIQAQVNDKGESFHTPLIFDDPISSLDYRYEKYVINRLVELSLERQVIVFTHRLSLVVGMRDAVKDKTSNTKKNIKIIEIMSDGRKKGIVKEHNSITLKPKDQLEHLLQKVNENIETTCEGDSIRHTLTQGFISDYRKIIEKSIEDVLLCGIVSRYRPNIITNTRNFNAVAAITEEDIRIVSEQYAKYCEPLHSHPDEAPEIDVDIETLRDDISEFKEWVEKRIKQNKKEFGVTV